MLHRRTVDALICVVIGGCLAGTAWGKRAEQAESGPAKPATPAVDSITIEPSSLTLQDSRDARQVLVWGKTKDGQRFDLSDEAAFKGDSNTIAIDSDRYITPRQTGDAVVTITAAGKEAKLTVKVLKAGALPVRFTRDVMPVLASIGCNAGTCHGSAKGKNGFKLSLRGYDAEYDYNALVNELQGRRVNRVDPTRSLMLLKPTAVVPHEGGHVLEAGSRRYQIILDWITQGAKFEIDAGTARPNSLEVLPHDVALDLPGRTQRLIVLAHYPDGTVRDVTRDAVLSSNSIEVAKIASNEITGLRRGEAAILIRYEGNYAVANVSIMGDRTGFEWASMPENNFVDHFINAKLEKSKILPSELCSDAEFVRRIYLDLTGGTPTAAEARAFVEDTTPEKRQQLVDKLLGSKEFVDFWSNKWADLLQCNSKTLGEKGVWLFREWIREAVAQNVPYDQFARSLVTAEGSSLNNPAVNYMRTLRETGKITEDVSQTFLGIRFNCNKCHDHPFERWTQDQYYQFGAFFARVSFKPGAQAKEEIVYDNFNGGEVTHPKTDKVVDPKVPYGDNPDWRAAQARQAAFADWLVDKRNPFFAESYANRVWSYFFGRGIIDPVDDIRASNPPVNPELLEALTGDFVKSDFNVQHLIRSIVLSRTYQLSIAPNKWNDDDRINFSHAIPRRLTAEQMMNAVASATGTSTQLSGLPAGLRPEDEPDGMVEGNDFLKLFGRPKRESACECERTNNVSLAHALNLINGHLISDAVSDDNGVIAKLVAGESDNHKVIEQIFYMTLNRPPTEREQAGIDLGSGPQRVHAAQDLSWALMNSPAFLFNR